MIPTKRNFGDKAIGALIIHERELDDADPERGWKADRGFAEDHPKYPRRPKHLCKDDSYLMGFSDWDDWCCDACYLENTGKKRPTIGGPKA